MLDQCAACEKESDSLKTCSGCNAVKYCNADCQKIHRKQHKADCKKRAAEFEMALFEIGKRAAELRDEILFKKPPPKEDCPICMLLLPCDIEYTAYRPCCGKTLCCGCVGAMASNDCPFCRKPASSSEEEEISRLNIRMEVGDADAFSVVGSYHLNGDANAFNMMGGVFLTVEMGGLKQDMDKALEMFFRAAELGSMDAHNNIATIYYHGQLGVEIDPEKYVYHWQQAAIRGCAMSRHNLGVSEAKAGNIDRAVKHWMISAGNGCEESLNSIRAELMRGCATKFEYETALRDYQAYIDEVKSYQRDVALKKGIGGGKK